MARFFALICMLALVTVTPKLQGSSGPEVPPQTGKTHNGVDGPHPFDCSLCTLCGQLPCEPIDDLCYCVYET